MKNIKNFKLFFENYEEEVDSVLENEENNYILMNGDTIISGFEFLNDCFTHLVEVLEGNGEIKEEQKFELEDYINETNVEELEDQLEIDEYMNDLLDKFEIVEPYKIMMREELENTPIDITLDDDNDDDINIGDIELDYETILGESFSNINESHLIVGDINGKTEEIDSFISSDEANEYLTDYKNIYNEFDNIRIIHKDEMNEQLEIDEILDDDISNCECETTGDCTCDDNCMCHKCDNCDDSKSIKKFDEFVDDKD